MSRTYSKRLLKIIQERGMIDAAKSVRLFLQRETIDKIVRHGLLTDEQIFEIQTMKNELLYGTLYNAFADPFEPIHIDPTNIEYRAPQVPHIDYIGLGRIIGGDWDCEKSLIPIDNDWVITGLMQRFQEEKDWEETIYFKEAEKRFSSGRETVRGAQNIDQFLHERCEYVDNLYNDIKTNGYRLSSEDSKKENEKYRGNYKDYLEILVVIDRKGRIHLHKGGFHRFAIARLLEINIPVHVVCRHTNWQRIRESMSSSGSLKLDVNSIEDHPDLQNIR